jgi:hypothetical protein
MYIWGVTHFGTPWNGVNTNIKIKLEVEQWYIYSLRFYFLYSL